MWQKYGYLIYGFLVLLISINILSYDQSFYFSQKSNVEYYEEEVNNLLSYFIFGEFNSERYSQVEQIHLKDVRTIFMTSWVLILMLGVLWSYFIYKTPLKRKFLVQSGTSSLVLITILTILSLNFSWFFTKLHEILFWNDFWLLPAESTLITLFPESFFIQATTRILLYSLLLSSFLLVLGLLWSKRWQKKKNLSTQS